ncbi:Signal peptidase, peptidase S26 [Alkalispirochaeta americana]|uniref:Signal peptidase, peptidase S26 n=1 Tax=Alkalispirochaeta americana TaxID=159291 RepID=A0A1N6P9Z1_9SPIO|nr:S26 family signal peptidase [Alkalispirochaeta americana]SIQ01076.1 Signal peptidase, peptidase S26 [Alkalispirochaeta americana]
MSDRSKRKGLRGILVLHLLFVVAVYVGFRSYGPALISVQGTSLAPLLVEGDLVLAHRDTKVLQRGTLVFARAPFRTTPTLRERIARFRSDGPREPYPHPVGGPVLRFVAALPGDRVIWDHQGVSVGSARYTIPYLHRDLPHRQEEILVQEGEVFLLALEPGRADSRVVGVVSEEDLLFRVQSIVWPRERRKVLYPRKEQQAAENLPEM